MTILLALIKTDTLGILSSPAGYRDVAPRCSKHHKKLTGKLLPWGTTHSSLYDFISTFVVLTWIYFKRIRLDYSFSNFPPRNNYLFHRVYEQLSNNHKISARNRNPCELGRHWALFMLFMSSRNSLKLYMVLLYAYPASLGWFGLVWLNLVWCGWV